MEENAVDHRLVLVRDRRDLLGQRENNVKVLDGKEVGVTLVQPLRADQGLTFRAVPIAVCIPRKLDTDSTANWTPIPREPGQSERSDAGLKGFTLRLGF
jgi:hypothetical protein